MRSGSFLLKVDASTVVAPVSTAFKKTQFDQALQWLTGATLVTAFGLVVVAIVSSAAELSHHRLGLARVGRRASGAGISPIARRRLSPAE